MDFLFFIKDLLLATLGQMATLFLGFLLFGLLIHFISQLTFKSLANAFGPRGTYFVAWLGTPVHELGHVLFCLIFMHKIEEIRFFQPDKNTGTLGYVYHKWNPKNPWHVLGNFFIGIGPIVLGCAALFALFYFLIPGSSRVWDSIIASVNSLGANAPVGDYFVVFKDSILSIINIIFTSANLHAWQFWVFLYLSICIASNVRLSWADFKGSLSGLGCIVMPFLILNLILLLVGRTADSVFPYTASILGTIYSLLILALMMVSLGFILIYFFSAAYYRLRYRHILNPFR